MTENQIKKKKILYLKFKGVNMKDTELYNYVIAIDNRLTAMIKISVPAEYKKK